MSAESLPPTMPLVGARRALFQKLYLKILLVFPCRACGLRCVIWPCRKTAAEITSELCPLEHSACFQQ